MESPKRALIVEDELVIASDLEAILNKENFHVTEICNTSKKALKSLSECLPDIVLLDINLQGNLNGIEIANTINEKYKIPFIYITAYSDPKTVEYTKFTEPYGFIIKPFEPKKLISTIKLALFKHNSIKIKTHTILNEQNEQLYAL
tara:strand:+ start:761 stop:1198 length:438 start_codon:yes stop_codon:yes gene_type:complete